MFGESATRTRGRRGDRHDVASAPVMVVSACTGCRLEFFGRPRRADQPDFE